MNDEIKEDVSDLMELLETTSKKEFYRLTIDHELVVRLYNYITNLQQEKEYYKSRCEKAIEYFKYQLENLDFYEDTKAKMLCAMGITLLQNGSDEK